MFKLALNFVLGPFLIPFLILYLVDTNLTHIARKLRSPERGPERGDQGRNRANGMNQADAPQPEEGILAKIWSECVFISTWLWWRQPNATIVTYSFLALHALWCIDIVIVKGYFNHQLLFFTVVVLALGILHLIYEAFRLVWYLAVSHKVSHGAPGQLGGWGAVKDFLSAQVVRRVIGPKGERAWVNRAITHILIDASTAALIAFSLLFGMLIFKEFTEFFAKNRALVTER